MVDFTPAPKGEITEVAWVMHDPAPYLMKIIHLFLDMGSMVGKGLEAGLANLKTISEQ